MDIILFGDQTSDPRVLLTAIIRRKGGPILSSLFERVHLVLQDEISFLQENLRRKLPSFSNVFELVEKYYASGWKHPAMESALTSLAQLAHFIGFYEQGTSIYLSLENSRVVGVCTGLFAAAAVSSANSLSALVALALEAVRISFRVGALVATTGDLLEYSGATDNTWAIVVGNLSESEVEQELNAFHVELALPESNQAYISASNKSSITISGPPSTLKRLFNSSEILKTTPHQKLAIRGLYHANHLYDLGDVDAILSSESRDVLSKYESVYSTYSSEGVLYTQATSTLEIFRSSILEILTRPIYWDSIIAGCILAVQESKYSTCRVLSMGPTILGNNLISAFRAVGGISLSSEDHISWAAENRPSSTRSSRKDDFNIAIVGMAGRFPEADSLEEFWKLLGSGMDVHRTIPEDRFDANSHTDSNGKGRNTSSTPYGCFIQNPGHFDAQFFNMSPREATQTDPMQRLALITAYEAMEMAGIVLNRTPSSQADRIGTFYGQTSDDWREINAAQDIDTYFITGGVRAFGPGRINYHFGFSGPSFSIDTACSSSLAAINLACTSLKAGDCDTAFTGGMNVMTNPDIFSGLSKGQFLSKTGSCKTFDNSADGYCRGDGVVTLILKRLDDALADRDPVLGIIRGISTNHSSEAVSITHPHVDTQKFLFEKVMKEADSEVNDVDYVEMHGTGTQPGDRVEMDSVSSIFAPRGIKKRKRPVFVGSVKSNIGHGEAVSGASSLVKCLLMLEKNKIPPQCAIGTINEGFPKDLDERNLRIAFDSINFQRDSLRPRAIFINNFSAAGGNTALLLQDGPGKVPLKRDPRTTHIVVTSAKSPSALKQNVQRLAHWIQKHPDLDLGSLAYTTTARRKHYAYRLAIPLSNISNLSENITTLECPTSPISNVPPNIAFVFTGQGSYYVSMGASLFEHNMLFRRLLTEFDRMVRIQGYPSFLGLITGEAKDSDSETVSPVVVQLSLVCIQMALAQLWQSWGIMPGVVIGHSLGEYAALYTAGVLHASDTINLVGRRARLLIEKCSEHSHGMLVVRSDQEQLDPFISSEIEVACVNSPQETVVSGCIGAITKLQSNLVRSGIKCKKLEVPFAFHSSQMEPLLEPIARAASSTIFNKPNIHLISPLLGQVINSDHILGPSYLSRHCRETVNFLGALQSAWEDKIVDNDTIWMEMGPQPLCSNMIKSTFNSDITVLPTLRQGEDAWSTVAFSLASLYKSGAQISWSEYHKEFGLALEVLRLPTYAFDYKNYWIQYENDWCLTKGKTNNLQSQKEAEFLTTSVHKIVQQEIQSHSTTIIAESNLEDPLLRAAISGHLVHGVALCPSSLYADMAITIGEYGHKFIKHDDEDRHINVRSMEVHKPLIIESSGPIIRPVLRIEAQFDLGEGSATIKYVSLSADRKSQVDHAKCIIEFESATAWLAEWRRIKFLVESRISHLRTSPGVHRIYRGMAYKLFSSMVDYDPKYRGMEEVHLDSGNLEATSLVSFQCAAQDGTFSQSPYYIDSLAHLSGFVVNANDQIDRSKAYLSQGWETMRFSRKLDLGRSYRAYVKMESVPGAEQVVSGDLYVFEDSDIVAVVGGIKFQCVPRRLLDILLKASMGDDAAAQSVPARLQPQPRNNHLPSFLPPRQENFQTRSHLKATDTFQQILSIIAQEIGCNTDELTGSVNFAALGVDSLMSLAIVGRLREELDVDMSNAIFLRFPTISELERYFDQSDGDGSRSSINTIGGSSTSTASTISTFTDITEYSVNGEEALSPYETGIDGDRHLIEKVRCTIASEMGINVDEIRPETDLRVLGMDSLMSLSILSHLRETTSLSLDSNFLTINTSMTEIESSLGLRKVQPQSALLTSEAPHLSAPKVSKSASKPLGPYPAAQPILLQGNSRICERALFLLPDGSGSCATYANIPKLSDQLAVYGLNCPFMRDPSSFTIGIPAVVGIYLAAIKRLQPEGPYFIGGWSAGGVLAYELTRQLLQSGERVRKLVLIDSPFPIGLEALPSSFHQFCAEIGLLQSDGREMPSWLLPHFAASVRELTAYSQLLGDRDLDVSGMPQTTTIWATDGIVGKDGPRPDWDESIPMPNSMKWLSEDRSDLGTNGWEKLVGAGNVRCVSTRGNHFTMMREPIIQEVGELIREALGLIQ